MLSALLSTLLLASSTFALPQVLDEARAAVILSILEKAERDGHDVGLVARQLFGGNDEFAPYEMPCPSDYTWVRDADVSENLFFFTGLTAILGTQLMDRA